MISALNNTAATTARFTLDRNQRDLGRSLTRLATGRKINAGKDGPAALIAAERLSAEIEALEAENRTLDRAYANANIADAQVGELSGLQSRLKGLVVSSANSGALSDAEISANQTEIDSIVTSIERITGGAISSLDGFNLPDSGNAALEAELASARDAARTLKSGGANSLSSGNFAAASAAVDGAIDNVTSARGTIGAFQRNNVEPRTRSNQVALANLSESRSRLADTDYATEMSNFAKSKTLTAAGIKVLKIAQSQAGSILDLFA